MNNKLSKRAVSDSIGYVIISAILLILILITLLISSPVIFDNSAKNLSESSIMDIGTGISIRIVDLSVIEPEDGSITSKFDIPEKVADREFRIHFRVDERDSRVIIDDGSTSRIFSLGGFGESLQIERTESYHGLNKGLSISIGE